MIESESRIFLTVDETGVVNELIEKLEKYRYLYGNDATFVVKDTQFENTNCLVVTGVN